MGEPISPSDLKSIAAACGSDVSFFLSAQPSMLARGVGDELSPAAPFHNTDVVLVKPTTSTSTAEAYRKLSGLAREHPEYAPEVFYNDFERVADCESLELIDLLLTHGASIAHLCGSGSAVYGICGNEMQAKNICDAMRSQGLWSVATRTLDKWPEPEWIA